MTDQLDIAAIRERSQQPGYQEGQALQDAANRWVRQNLKQIKEWV